MAVNFILLVMPIKHPYSLWNLRNYFWMTRSQLCVKQIIMSPRYYFKCGYLQSSQVKRTPQDYINEFIIRKLNLLVVADFRFISAFLHARKRAVNSHARQLRNCYQLSFPEFDLNGDCLLWNLTHSKIFNLTKYREVLVKYSLRITHAGMPIWIWH